MAKEKVTLKDVASDEETTGSRVEERAFELGLENQSLQNKGLGQDIDERKKYAERVFIVICAWVAWTFAGLFMQAIHFRGFNLSDGVIIAFIGGTTANVIGLFAIVMNYLFERKKGA